MTTHALHSSSRLHLAPRYLVLAAIVIALGVFIWIFDWNWFKHPIERRIQAATGREFTINGDLKVHLGLVPVLRVEGLRLGNAAGATDPDMARIGELEVGVRLLSLLQGRIDLPVVKLDKPYLSLERNADGQGNWQFDRNEKPEDASPGKPWRIGQLVVTGGELRVHEAKLRTDLRLEINTATPGDPAAGTADSAGANSGENRKAGEGAEKGGPAPLLLKGEGRYRDGAFQLSGRVDSPLELRDSEKPYHIDMRATAGATHAHVQGDLIAPMQMQDINLYFALSGQNLADLHKLLGIVLPDSPPYSLGGELGHGGAVWSYNKFSGRVGESDLRGDISVDTGRKRWLLRGDLASRELKLDDLSGFLGAGPGAKKDATASPQQRQEAVRRETDPRVLPHHEYDLAKLRSMDADVKLNARHIFAETLPVEGMNVHLQLEDGLLRLDPLEMKVADGSISGKIQLDARQDPIDSALDLKAKALDLPKLMPSMKAQNVGRVGGYVKLQGRGNSVGDMLGVANGEAGIAMGRGRLSNLMLELAGLDVAESLEFLVEKDKTVPIRCAYGDVEAKEGVFTIRAMALDTTDTVVFGEGSTNLRDETLAMKLKVKPKDMSPLALRSPLRITGTLKHPKVRPELGPLALRALAAVALGAIALPAALIPLIETGPGKDTDCGASAGHVPEVDQGGRVLKKNSSAPDNAASRPAQKDPAGASGR